MNMKKLPTLEELSLNEEHKPGDKINYGGVTIYVGRDTSGGQDIITYKAPSVSSKTFWSLPSLQAIIDGKAKDTNESVEVHYSDGVRQLKPFTNIQQANTFVKDLIKNNKKLQFADIYQAGVSNTSEPDKLISWWGDNSYWYNKSKTDNSLMDKKFINESLKKSDFIVGDATGYLIPNEADLDKMKEDDIYKKMNAMHDKSYSAQVGNRAKELDELSSALNFMHKYLELKYGVSVREVLEKRCKADEAKTVDGESIDMTMKDFERAVKDMFGLKDKFIHVDDIPEILNDYDIVWMTRPIKNDKAGIELMKKILAADGSWTVVDEDLNESYTVSVGKGQIDSADQAAALIPDQKEVDGELVDFEEGEKITVSDGENKFKFVWTGGKAVEAPEEQTNESHVQLDDNMKRIILQALKYFKSGSSSDSNMGKKHASDEEIDFVINSLK